MLRKIVFAAACFALCVAGSINPARAVDSATAVTSCGGLSLTVGGTYGLTQDLTGELCTNAAGGGGGGLSVTDAATWTTAVSAFTPTGGVFNDSAAALVSGHQGTVRLNANREMHVTCDAANTLCSLLGAAIPVNVSAVATAVTGHTVAGNTMVDTNIQTMGGAALGTAGSANTSVMTVQGIASMTPILSNNTPQLATSGGYSTTFFQPTAGDNHTNLKNGAGQVYWVLAENNSATVNYLRLYNAATGFNGCNSATNLVTQIQIPASTSVGGVNIPLPYGIPFSTGISYCVTSGYATNDTTNATASAMSITIGYN